MNTERGYFILADITGFTHFVAESELEHSKYILNEILKLILGKFSPEFTLAEIEGDAIFFYAPAEKFSRGELILEMIESCYYTFRDRKATFKRLATCNCKACEMVHTLDLKYIVHSGDYVLNDIAGTSKPLGTPVNVLHRLVKNKVYENTGWTAYILFTEECLAGMDLKLTDTFPLSESYDHLGSLNTFSLNLNDMYKKFINTRVSYISEKEADYSVTKNYPVTQPVLWEWVNNPIKRSMWLEVSDWSPFERPEGRTGKGAINHCANSDFFENLLDYRPFDYYTSELVGKNLTFRLTGEFDPIPAGTKFTWRIKIESKLPSFIRKYYGIFVLKVALKMNKAFHKLELLITESNSKFIQGISNENKIN